MTAFVRPSKVIGIVIIVLSVVLCCVQLKLSFVPPEVLAVKGLLQCLRGVAFGLLISMLAMNTVKIS